MKKQIWNYKPLEGAGVHQHVIITRLITAVNGKQQPYVMFGWLSDGVITNSGYAWQPMPKRLIDDGNLWSWVLHGEPDVSDNVIVVASDRDYPKIVFYDAEEMVFRGGFKNHPPLAWMPLPKPANPPKILPTWCNGVTW